MTEIVLAGFAVSVLSLIFSSSPFINLVYFLACIYCTEWDQFYTITGLMFIAIIGYEIVKGMKK